MSKLRQCFPTEGLSAKLREVATDFSEGKKGRMYGIRNLSRMSDIDYPNLNRLINHGGNPSAYTLYRISKVTGVSVDWMLGLTDKKYRREDEHKHGED